MCGVAQLGSMASLGVAGEDRIAAIGVAGTAGEVAADDIDLKAVARRGGAAGAGGPPAHSWRQMNRERRG